MQEHQNTKTFLQKVTVQIGVTKISWLKRLEILFLDLKGEEIVETFYEKELQKTHQKEFRAHKVIRRKGDELNVKCKGCNNSSNGNIGKKKKILLNKMSSFPKPHIHSKNKIEIELDLANYVTKFDLENVWGIDPSKYAKKLI